MKKFLAWLSMFLFATSAYGLSTIVKPYTFTAHTGATAAQVNANEDTEVSAINNIINEITAGTGSINAATFNGYSTSQSAIARHIAVRDSNGKLAGDILGNAATATSATNADTVDTFHASATPGANQIPVLNDSSVLALPNATHTINGNTIWHAGNDGSGSALDAGRLQGKLIISGSCDANGAIITGTGFTSGRQQTGLYLLSWAVPFASTPICVTNGFSQVITSINPSTTGASVYILSHDGSAYNTAFQFICYGP